LPGLFASSQKLPLISAGSNPLSEANCTRAQQKLGKDARARGPKFFLFIKAFDNNLSAIKV